MFQVQRSHKAWLGSGAFDSFRHRARQSGWHVRRHASHERDFHGSHKAQRVNVSLKPNDALRKVLLDQQAEPLPQVNDVPSAGEPPVDRAQDEIQAAPAQIIQHEAGQTIGMASVIRAADAAQNTPPPLIERKGTPVIGSLDGPSAMMLMVVVAALGLAKFLLRRRYAKHSLAAGAMRRLPPPDNVRPVDLSWRSQNQFEADPDASSCLEAVKIALDTIAKANAEMASSRQLRTPS